MWAQPMKNTYLKKPTCHGARGIRVSTVPSSRYVRTSLGAALGSVPAVEVLVPVLKHKPANRRFILFILCTLFILLLVLLVLLVLL